MNCSSISMYPFGNLNTMKIEIIQGDDYTAKLQVTDENGIIDHTLISKIYFTSKGANINKTFVYEEEVESYFLYLNPEETYEINKGTYSFDITIYFVSPHTQTKIYRGDLIVKEKINDPLITKPERYTNEEINELLGQRELRFVKGNAEELDIVPNETICYSFTPLKYYKNFDCINEYIGSYVDNGLSKTLVNEFNKNSLGIKPGVTIAYEKKTVGPFDEISKYYGYYTGLSEDSLVKILAPHLLKSDLVDDNEQVNKFVTEEEKEQITTNKNSIQAIQIELNSKSNLDYVNSQLNTKVDKVEGKQLSTNDYTNEDKSKVNIITTEGSSDKFLNEQGEYVALQVSADQTYNPNSTNAQSGKAVAQAIADNVIDDNYVHTDNNYTNQDKAQVEKISDIESELNNKVDKVEGKQLSTNDYTDEDMEFVENLKDLIPNQASSENQLADKDFVNSSIATNTANLITKDGEPFESLAELQAYSGTLTNNDYAYIVTRTGGVITAYNRYKYNGNTHEWGFEFTLNNSSFTAQQWAAINSGITNTLVEKIQSDATTDYVDLAIDTVNSDISDLSDEIDNKLTQVTSTADSTRVYSIAANGTQGVIPTSYDPIASSLVRFDTGGTIHCGTPTANNHAANKGYVDNGLDGKVSRLTISDGNTRIYTNTNGVDSPVTLAAGGAPYTIPYRYDGGRIQVGSPVATTDAANKGYVDSKQPSISSQTATTYSGAINSNTTYKFSNPTTSITISGFTVTSGDNDPIWSIMFKAGANMVLSVPDTVKWDSGDEPAFEEGKTYNVMFKQGIGSEYIGRWGEF